MGPPAKNSIHADVSTTTPLTGTLEIDRQPYTAFERHGFVIRVRATQSLEPFHERVGDPTPCRVHRLVEQVSRQIGSDAADRGHIVMITGVLTLINTPDGRPRFVTCSGPATFAVPGLRR